MQRVLERTEPTSAPVPVVLVSRRNGRSTAAEPTRRAVVRFAVGTLVALIVVTLVAFAVGRQAAEREAVFDARRITEVLASTVLENNIDQGLLDGDPAAIARLDKVVKERLVQRTDLRRIKLWTLDGVIVYSDEPRAIGLHFPSEQTNLATALTDSSHAQVSDLSEGENMFEHDLGPRLLEVYTSVRTPGGEPLLLEAYYSYDVVTERRSIILRSFAAIGAAGVLTFLLIQLTIGWRSLRWLRRERDRLLDEAAEAAERERRRIASDVHDGVVQELVGASYVVSSAVGVTRRCGHEDVAGGLEAAALSIRTTVRSLRSMIVDIYPASLRSAGLRAALSDLVSPMVAKQIDVTLDVAEDLDLPVRVQAAVYRIAQEACRNVVRHAEAQHLDLRLTVGDGSLRLTVRDDGVGFDASAPVPCEHVGLRTMADLVADVGGTLVVRSSAGHGTTLEVEIPT